MKISKTQFKLSPIVPSVNFHLWQPCNMQCDFCFAPFLDVMREMKIPKGHLPERDCMAVVEQVADIGYKKMNFVGGEPTLCPWLSDLIVLAKERGMVTSIVTNGSRITGKWLDNLNGSLDWIGLSIDTVDPEKSIRIGRAIAGRIPITQENYLDIIGEIKRHKIRLKINTVVNSVNCEEDLTSFIQLAKPERWKLFQVLQVKGQNDAHIAKFEISTEQFEAYVQRNHTVESHGITVVPENNEAMTESYVMIDPAGRFFDNTQGFYRYSESILKIGVAEALKQVSIDPDRFRKRGGEYDW